MLIKEACVTEEHIRAYLPCYCLLYTSLKELRNELAREAGIPAYAVFHNSTLEGLARLKPTTRRGAKNVHGIGAVSYTHLAAKLRVDASTVRRRRDSACDKIRKAMEEK